MKRYRISIKTLGLKPYDFYLEATSFSDARRRAREETRFAQGRAKILDVMEVRQ